MMPAVALLPEQPSEPQRRPDEDDVVELVDVPLVEQELVERLVLARELDRQLGLADVEVPGDQEAERHHHRRQQRDAVGHVVHGRGGCGCSAELEQVAEERLDTVPDEQLLERIARQDRAGRQERERDQDHQRALARGVVVMAVVRPAVERHQDQPP